jgi:hypothetical protein
VNVEHQERRDQEGADRAIEVSTSHCESCGSFILRESREITGKEL